MRRGGIETATDNSTNPIGKLSGSVTTTRTSPVGRQANTTESASTTGSTPTASNMLPGGTTTDSTSTTGWTSTTQSASPLAAPATSTNPIVLENQKPGNPQSEWDIEGAGSSNIEGFATDISVNRGNRIDFKINTNSSNYRIDVYRMGYYGGMGARKVATIQHTGVQNQPAPLRDADDRARRCRQLVGLVILGHSSGCRLRCLYRKARAPGRNSRRKSYPVYRQRRQQPSDVVFQTSDTTWQAYNGWGGANFYGGNGPATGQGAGRAYAVSYNRPIATRGGVGQACRSAGLFVRR